MWNYQGSFYGMKLLNQYWLQFPLDKFVYSKIAKFSHSQITFRGL